MVAGVKVLDSWRPLSEFRNGRRYSVFSPKREDISKGQHLYLIDFFNDSNFLEVLVREVAHLRFALEGGYEEEMRRLQYDHPFLVDGDEVTMVKFLVPF